MWRLFSFITKHNILIAALILVSIGAALLEGFGVALVFPVLQGTSQLSDAQYPFPLNLIFSFFSDIPLARRLQIVAVLLLLTTLIKNMFIYASYVFSSRLQLIVMKHFRLKCVNELMRVGMNYFNKQRTSDFQIIIDGYTDTAAGAIVGLVGQALPQIFTALVLLIFLFLLSWKLTIASLILVFLVSFLLHGVSRNILIASKLVYEARMNFNRVLLDILNGMKLIRFFSQEEHLVHKFGNNVEAFNNARHKGNKLIGMVAPVFEATGIGMLAVILFIGAFLIVDHGQEWLGVLFTFVVILSRMIGPVKIINHARATILEKLPIMQEITRLLSPAEKEYVQPGTRAFAGFRDRIELHDLTFRYNPTTPVVLQEVSFVIPKGSRIGIVGPSGSGKSTLVELLLRFYDPQSGHILVDGIDLKEMNVNSWRRFIGVVSQDVFLFNDTIKANIAFAKPNATQGEIEGAAKKAYAHEFILQLPDGYDTRIGERGILLSGGQRQRLSIARAVIADPEILIFDEATSALDTESERFVQAAIDTIGEGKTVVTIAHRLSTVFDSDKILVLDRGRIIEQGRHGELLAHSGLYAKLVKMQELEGEIKEETEKKAVKEISH